MSGTKRAPQVALSSTPTAMPARSGRYSLRRAAAREQARRAARRTRCVARISSISGSPPPSISGCCSECSAPPWAKDEPAAPPAAGAVSWPSPHEMRRSSASRQGRTSSGREKKRTSANAKRPQLMTTSPGAKFCSTSPLVSPSRCR
eukprot:scaffold64635_cov66-Phaeocystis_antarctica.AAC.4